jgi:hypothetical protein
MSDKPAMRPLEQRCWNHAAREAVCRCPGCTRCFCRECVTEHESRLLCVACLRDETQAVPGKRGSARRLLGVLMSVAGVVLAWAIFFAAAESLLTLAERSERVSWQSR